MRWATGIAFLLVAAVPYVAMLFTGRPDADVGTADETLLIISPHRREVRLEYSRGFAEWMKSRHDRDVDVRWLDVGGTSKILKDLESRFTTSPGAPGVDILFGGGVSPFYRAVEHGWLTQMELPAGVIESVPSHCAGSPVYDQDRYWFGVALSGFGILYNRPLVERVGLPAPRAWDDLGRAEYLSWVSSGDPRSSGSVHMCYEIILQAYGFEDGWGLITRICANVRRFGEGGGAAPREVAAGDAAAGMVIDQYAHTVIEATGPGALDFVLPEGATVINADSIALLRDGPSPELAQQFVEYALSEDGQRLLFQPKGTDGQVYSLHRLPVRKDLYEGPSAPATRPYEYGGDFEYDMKKGSRRWRVVNDLIGVWLIDAHADLARAWRAVIAAGMPPGIVQQLCTAPIAEEEAEELAGRWKNPRRRLETMNNWAQRASARYSDVARQAERENHARGGRGMPAGNAGGRGTDAGR